MEQHLNIQLEHIHQNLSFVENYLNNSINNIGKLEN